MVRKTTAVEVTKKTTPAKKATDLKKEVEKNVEQVSNEAEDFLMNARSSIKENYHMILGVVALLRWLIVLKEFLFGMLLVTAGILLVSGFFKKNW